MFKNITQLDDGFLNTELGFTFEGYSLKPNDKKTLYRDYYFLTCNSIRRFFYLKPTNSQIEEYIKNGTYTHTDSLGNRYDVTCPIPSEEERKYFFKMAAAKQLMFDIPSGRAAMLRGENISTNLCRDAIDYIKQLGLYQRTLTCI